MRKGILKLANNPAGFDVFTRMSEGEEPVAAAPGVEVALGQRIRIVRQPQFEGSAEIIFEIDGVRQPAQETGTADVREDFLAHSGNKEAPYMLQTQAECLPKKSP